MNKCCVIPCGFVSALALLAPLSANAVPIVEIQVENSYARELNEVPATVEFVSSEAAPEGGLELSVTVSGSATPGDDYEALSLPLVIEEGESTLLVLLTPLDDGVFEDEEQIILTLQDAAAYDVGEISLATIFLQDSGRVFGDDVGVPDASDADAGTVDAGEPDASEDVSEPVADASADGDAGSVGDISEDAAPSPDAVGSPDADSAIDVAVETDAPSAPDADAGLSDASTSNPDVSDVPADGVTQPGTGCSSAPSGPGNTWWMTALVGLLMGVRPRRRNTIPGSGE